MHEAEERRVQERRLRLDNPPGATTGYPDLSGGTERLTYDGLRRGGTEQLKEELSHQIATRRHAREELKRREREQDLAHQEANKKVMAQQNTNSYSKRDKAMDMKDDWLMSVQFKEARRAIDGYDMAVSKATLGSTMSALEMARKPFTASPRTPRAAQREAMPQTPRQEVILSPPSSRPSTGSARRMPLGAAGSLALHKQRLAEALKR